MKKFFKGLFAGTIVILIIAFVMFLIFSDSDDYARISDVNYQAIVVDEEFSNGKVLITERITFDVHASSKDNLFWELWRELPEAYYDGVLVSYNVLSVKEIFDDNSELVYEESPRLYWDDEDFIDDSGVLGPNKYYHSEGPYDDYYFYESLIFYVDGIYRDTVTFEIVYEMFNATLRYNDSTELYLAMYSGDTSKYLKSFNAEILIPQDKMAKDGNYSAYTYGTNAHEFDFIESDNLYPGYHTFKFELDEDDLKFKAYNDYIEFALITYNEDKHVFSQFASENYYYYDDMLFYINNSQKEYEELPALYLQRKKTTFSFVAILSGIIVLIFTIIYQGFRRKYKLYKPTIELDYFRDIPSDLDANFARSLVFSHKAYEDDSDGFAAAMLSLAYKKYIDVKVNDEKKQMRSNNFNIVVIDNVEYEREPLSLVEKQYYDLISRHAKNEEISLNNFQKKISEDYEYTNTFVQQTKKAITKIGVDDGYFQIANYKMPQKNLTGTGIFMLIAGVVIMIVGNISIMNTRLDLAFGSFFLLGTTLIILGIYSIRKAKDYVLLTQYGVDEYTKWKGLYDFLNNETLMVERGVLELAIWEKYLIYATAFGISEKVIKALKVVMPKEMIESSPILSNRIYYTRSFRTSTHSFTSTAKTASYTYRSGGHSGYGGGGRGGGGGGGGH